MKQFTYSYYYHYFISFYCLSAFKYRNPHQRVRFAVEQITCKTSDIFRLQNSRDLNYLIFLFGMLLQTKDVSVKTLGAGKKSNVLVQTQLSRRESINFFERYILLLYPYYFVEPIKTRMFSNDQISLMFKGFRMPEVVSFKPGDYLAENLYDFSLFFQYSLQLLPKNNHTIYEQRFLLRALNVPLNNH